MARAKKHPALVAGGPWHQLASGAPFALEGPATPLAIEDVAASLSKICRFAGACTRFYSVAQHSVLVAAIVRSLGGRPQDVLGALLHDTPEMVLGDIPSPAKRRLGDIKTLERDIERRVTAGLGVTVPASMANLRAIRTADLIALATERKLYMVKSTISWGDLPKPIRPELLGITTAALSPGDAERQFLMHWRAAITDLQSRRAA